MYSRIPTNKLRIFVKLICCLRVPLFQLFGTLWLSFLCIVYNYSCLMLTWPHNLAQFEFSTSSAGCLASTTVT